jgi:rubrerythrin
MPLTEVDMPEFVNPFSGKAPERPLSRGELLRALRLSLSAEEEAVHLYEAIADACTDELARAVLRDVAEEEKVHKGEFQRLIELLSPDESSFMQQGASEVDEMRQKTLRIENEHIPQSVGNLKRSAE